MNKESSSQILDYADNEEGKSTQNEVMDFHTLNSYKVKFRKMFTEDQDRQNNKHFYNGVDLRIDNSFGCMSLNIEANGLFVSEEEQTIVYPSGNHLARYNLTTNKTDFICREKNHTGIITAVTTGLTKKREIMIGVAEKDITQFNAPPVMSLYCCEREKWFYLDHSKTPNSNGTTYIKQALIPDFTRYCVTF